MDEHVSVVFQKTKGSLTETTLISELTYTQLQPLPIFSNYFPKIYLNVIHPFHYWAISWLLSKLFPNKNSTPPPPPPAAFQEISSPKFSILFFMSSPPINLQHSDSHGSE
jgi:hypothetical protein